MPLHKTKILLGLLTILSGCTNSNGAAIPKPPAIQTVGAGNAQPKTATSSAVAWTASQLSEADNVCLTAGSGTPDSRRQAFCTCIATAIAAKFPYATFKTDEQDDYTQVSRSAGTQCAAQAQQADTNTIVSESGSVNVWTQAGLTAAMTQCTTNIDAIGLQLDADMSSQACTCLLQPYETQEFSTFQQSTLPLLVSSKYADGSLKACLTQAGMNVDKVLTRSWGKPIPAGTYADGPITVASAAFDSTGQKIGVVWILTDPTDGPELWARLFDPTAGGWQTAIRISESSAYVGVPQIVFYGDGSVHAYWEETTATGPVINASVYGTASWGAPVALGAKTFTNVNGTDFSFEADAVGRVVVINVDATTNTLVIVNEYDNGLGWAPAKALNSPTTASLPRLALGSAGDLVAGWIANGTLVTSALENAVWAAPIAIDAPPVDGPSATLAIDRPGYMLASWLDSSATPTKVTSTRYTTLGSWEKTSVAGTGVSVASPNLVLTENGGAVGAWIDNSAAQKVIMAGTFHIFNGWSTAAAISDPATSIDSLTVVNGGSGRAIAVWTVDTAGKNGEIFVAPFE